MIIITPLCRYRTCKTALAAKLGDFEQPFNHNINKAETQIKIKPVKKIRH
jgi:hypothetical protein